MKVGLVRYCFSHKSQKRFFFNIQDSNIKLQKSQQQIILPQQYPKGPLNDTTPMVHRGRPVRYIEDKDDIPDEKHMQNDMLVKQQNYGNKWKSPENAYVLNIGLIGPVNSGKSELMSKLVGSRMSAVSPKANTTSQIIKAFKFFENYRAHKQDQHQGLSKAQSQGGPEHEQIRNIQLRYFDTPGMMYRKTGFLSKGWKVLSDIDFSLLVVDSAKRFDDIVKQSIRRLQKHRNYQNFMKALVLNKIDLVDNKRKFHSLISEIERYGKFDKIFYTSAITGYGIQQLQQYLLRMSKPGEWENPKQSRTDLTQIQVYQQMFKEAIYNRAYKQIPYILGIQCISTAMKSNSTQVIKFKLTVETQNQQRMMIGTKGTNIQNIIKRFKVLFADNYQRECECFVMVRVRDQYNQRVMGSDENINLIDQKEELRKKIQTVHSRLKASGKLFKIENESEDLPEVQSKQAKS